VIDGRSAHQLERKIMLISTYFKENSNSARAEVLRNEVEKYYYIDFYDTAGNKLKTKELPGKSLDYVEDVAHSWALNIEVLLG
jgi:hypothetical protein